MRTALRRPVPVVALATLVAASTLVASAAQAAEPVLDTPLRLETGHIDAFNLALNDDNSVRLTLKEDVTGSHVLHTPESVELFVKRDAHLEGLPPAYLPPGAPTALWYLPITQDQNLIWPGWDSQGVAGYYGSDADVDIVVSDVDGPGQVFLWSQGTFGDVQPLLTSGYTFPGTIHQSFLAHVHANWGFTAAGTYRLTAHATVTSQDGTRTSTSNTATYTFVVQPLTDDPGEPGEPDVTVSITGVPQHYHTGDVATLTAVLSPVGASDHLHWFTRPTAADEWTEVEGAEGTTYGFVVTTPRQVKVVAYDESHAVLAESEPVDIAVDDHGSTPGIGPELHVSLPQEEGALAISVSPEGRSSTLSDLTLSPEADRYTAEGAITGITVTDTRQGNLGWEASGRVRNLVTTDGAVLEGKYLGWTPHVVSSSAGQSVDPGASVSPGFISGTGIQDWSVLGSAAAGSSLGTAVLGADLRIEAPTTTAVGDYTGVVLITVI